MEYKAEIFFILNELSSLVSVGYLEEILFNLLVNASQAIKETMKPGEIKMTALQEQSRVLIKVSDNGSGIPEDQIQNVFRPFHTTKEEGTGLGLYVTQQLVEKLGGRVKVKSTVSKGTTFTIALPISTART